MDAGNLALAEYLAKTKRWEIHLVAHRASEDVLKSPRIIFHKVPRILGSNFLSVPLLAAVGKHHGKKVLARSGRVVVNGGNCDINDVNWVHYVHASHDPEFHGNYFNRWKGRFAHELYRKNESRIISTAKLVVVNSERTRKDLVTKLRINDANIKTIYYGCDPGRFKPTTLETKNRIKSSLGWSLNRLYALFVGALGDRRKGFDLLFDAWKTLCANPYWDVDLVVVGSGAELEKWKRAAREEKIADRIHFLGFRKDVDQILASSDVMVHPARYEAYGLGVQEAMYSGIPCIVSTEAGVAERYTPPMMPLLLVDLSSGGIVERLTQWHSSRLQFGNFARSLAKSLSVYDWEQMASKVESAL